MPLSGLLGAARCTWCSLTCSVSLQSLLIFPWPSSLCVSMSTSQISSFLLEGHQSLDLVCVCVCVCARVRTHTQSYNPVQLFATLWEPILNPG